MTIQKKSLISTLNTTKKAIVASMPLEAPTSKESGVKMGRLGRMGKLGRLGKMGRLGKLGKLAKLGKK
ncbi:MAG: hypothetical protein WBQ85_18400 [Candidatus Sulfotelmatobacter sp.]